MVRLVSVASSRATPPRASYNGNEPRGVAETEAGVGRAAKSRVESQTQAAPRSGGRRGHGALQIHRHVKISFAREKPPIAMKGIIYAIRSPTDETIYIGSSQATAEVRWKTWKSQAKQDWMCCPLLRYAHQHWGSLDPCTLAVLAEIEFVIFVYQFIKLDRGNELMAGNHTCNEFNGTQTAQAAIRGTPSPTPSALGTDICRS